MSTPESARLRSLNRRIADSARAHGQDIARIRRQVAFQRFVARVEGAGWVLKGGYCLEVRLPGSARATRDLDFVREGAVVGEDSLLDEIDALLERSGLDDGFVFEARSARLLRDPDDPSTAWRVSVGVTIDGREFVSFKVDLVSAFDEVAGATEILTVSSPVAGLDLPDVRVVAVDVRQHAAEKIHAMARLYAGERPSSRVKDLVDLALLLDAGLLTDRAALGARIRAVFAARDGSPPPAQLPRPPEAWADPYHRLVADLPLTGSSATAFALVQDLYRSALLEGHPA